jgi:YVTN family beta-propeller protein
MVAQPTKRCAFLTLLLVLSVAMLMTASAAGQQFLTVDVPGAASTLVLGINNAGQMVGSYTDASSVTHGFSLTGGVFTTIDFPGATLTEAVGINNVGEIVGSYNDSQGVGHGFLLSNGTFTSITDPQFACCATYVSAITDTGVIVGSGIDSNGNQDGFELVNGTFTTLDFPGANFTELLGIPFQNSTIVGVYSTSFPTGPLQGLTYSNGQFSTFDVSGATNTTLYGIADGGGVVGTYTSSEEGTHAFLTTCTNQSGSVVCSQNLTIVDFPGATLTEPSNLNDSGQVVGAYVDANNVTHGYLMTSGPFAYVANSGSNTVSVIDIATELPVSTISVGTSPKVVAIAPNGQQAYVTNSGGNSVSVIDTTSDTVVNTIPVQSGPEGVAFTPDGTEAYVANLGSNSVSVIDTASQTVVATVQVQELPNGVAMAPTSNGTFAYVTNFGSNTVSVISVASNTVTSTIPVGTSPIWVAITPDSSLAYVENAGSNNVSVISVATNTVTATIPVGMVPGGAAFTPDSSLAYVVNQGSNSVSVIATASNNVIATVTGFNGPDLVALTTDGSSAYVTNAGANTVSVVATATNTITGTIAVGSAPIGVAIAAAPPTTLQITLPLSPTQPNVFDFGPHDQIVQYPPNTQFNGINMTTVAVQITQATFSQRVAGTLFASATCIVYDGAGGNCVDYQVSCTDNNNNPVPCPSEPQPTILVQTDFSTSGPIVNPGYLTTPIGENQWQNIFTGFGDPTVRGKTKGFSEFVAVSLGATNQQGLANFAIVVPKSTVFTSGEVVPVAFSLTSVGTGDPVTDGEASIVIQQTADANGNPVSVIVLAKTDVFKQTHNPGVYGYRVNTKGYAAGTYRVTIYGNAFAAYQHTFKIVP